MTFFYFMVTPEQPGDFLMALDQVLLDSWDGPLLIRFYSWRVPTVSLGVHQHAEQIVNLTNCQRLGVDVVRRPTGGAAVLHHLELTYSVVGRPEQLNAKGTMSVYERISRCLIRGLQILGIHDARIEVPQERASRVDGFCFAKTAHYEVAVAGRKLIGSAQKWTHHRFVQHGSILIDFDPRYADVFHRNLFSRKTFITLQECLRRPLTLHEVSDAFCRGFAEELGCQPVLYQLPSETIQEATRLADKFLIFRPSPETHPPSMGAGTCARVEG